MYTIITIVIVVVVVMYHSSSERKKKLRFAITFLSEEVTKYNHNIKLSLSLQLV